MRSYLRICVGVFVFLVFGDSAPLCGQGSADQPPAVLCEPQKDYGEMCLGAVNQEKPLGSRIPVILIHGWEPKHIPGPPDVAVWSRIDSYLQQLGWFNQKYKLYYVSYYSNIQSIRDLGLTFIDLLDRMDLSDPAFQGKPLVIIGYSMGGLIARSYMQEPRFGSAGLGGNRVLRLITLGTPHHGTPLANGPARDDKAGGWATFLHKFVDGGLFGYDVRWYKENRFELRWDNYDGMFDYDKANENNNLWLERLNASDMFNGKIVAYGGVVTPLDSIYDCSTSTSNLLYCLAAIMNSALGVKQSDGFVPYDSALFYPCKGCATPRGLLNYSHSEMVSGKSDDDPLFQYIADDLLGAETRPNSSFDSYTDLGNPDDEWLHNLRGWGGMNPGLLPYAENDRTSRYQTLRSSNSVDLFVPQPGAPYQLTFRSEDGLCDDSFSVFVNGRGPVYTYSSRPPPIYFPLHSVRVGAEFVLNSRVTVTFRNQATDSCGGAAIYFVRLDRLDPIQSDVPTPVIRSISVSPSGVGLENATEFTFSANTNATSPQSTFVWQFGDGSSTTGGATATHVFSRSGTFTVQLTVTNSAGQARASTTVRVASLIGTWIATVTGHTTHYPSQRPITRVELRVNQSLPGSSSPPTRLAATWIDDAGCRAGTGYQNPYLYGRVLNPRSVSIGVEHLQCNEDSDFYLRGTADEDIRVITGTCGLGGSGCQFRMVRQ